MNIFIWVLQVLLALHTVMGAVWKVSNSEQTFSSVSSIPHSVWLAMSVFELICSVGLLLPALQKRWGILTPIAAGGIAAEMIFFCGVHLASGSHEMGQPIYWLVVVGFCAFIAYGRLVLRPYQSI